MIRLIKIHKQTGTAHHGDIDISLTDFISFQNSNLLSIEEAKKRFPNLSNLDLEFVVYGKTVKDYCSEDIYKMEYWLKAV